MMRAWIVIVSIALAGCLEAHVTQCADGVVCPAEKVCSPRGGCVTPQELAQCNPPPADNHCTLPGDLVGACFDGVCLPTGCGNGVVEPNEACDDGNKLGGDGCNAQCTSDESCGNGVLDTAIGEGCDCGDAAFTGTRPGSCEGTPNSSDPSSICTDACQIRGCGDGVRAGLEDCDGTDIPSQTTCATLGYYSGSIGCTSFCRYDTTACSGRCGDGTRNGPSGNIELCDGADLNARTCQDFGFYYPAGLACNTLCNFDPTPCTGSCGDGTYDSGHEACDPGESSAALAARGLDCTDFGFYAPGGLACSASCQLDTSSCGGGFCGDGIAQGTEECDGNDLKSTTCSAFGYYGPNTLTCRDTCTFSTASCNGGRCGDGTVNGAEACDGSVPAGTDCTDFGYYAAAGLACGAACNLETALCTGGRCGDNVVNGTEQCDGTAALGADCTDFGFYSAPGLGCSAGCTYSTTGCSGICGDNAIDGVEECDGSALGGADCTSFGFYSAPGLACTSCGYDVGACKLTCGDDLVNGPEVCDGAPPEGNACAFVGRDAGQLGCDDGCFESTSRCRTFGVVSELLPPGNPYTNDLWGQSGDIFAGLSSSPYILRRTNGTWTAATVALQETIQGVWGTSASDVFAVGREASSSQWGIQHFDGATWSAMTAPLPPARLRDVGGTSSTDVWAVGENATVLHYNGTWSKVTNPISTSLSVEGVWAADANTVWVVGFSGTIYKWTSGTWTSQSLAIVDGFSAVSGRSATDIYATTYLGNVYHFDGATWTLMPMGTCTASSPELHGIAVDPDGSAFVAGFSGATGLGYVCQLAGGIWHRIDDGTLGGLENVTRDGVDFYVGGFSSIARASSANWLPVGAPNMALQNDVWGNAFDKLYVVGGTGATTGAVRFYNGATWSTQTVPGSPATNQLQGIYGGSGWAVAAGNAGTLIVSNGAGGAWTAQSSGSAQNLRAVWGDTSFVHVVGDNGTALRRATGGTTWTSLTTGVTAQLNAVWGVPNGAVFAVGNSGTILRYTGTWSALTSGTTNDLLDVWGKSATDVYASGTNGTVLHFNGSSWQPINTGLSGALDNISGETGDLIVTTATGFVQYVGGRWLPIRVPVTGFSATAMWTTRDVLVAVRNTTSATDDLLALAGRIFAPEPKETVCDDFWDDDGNGLADCADPMCAASSACSAGGGCKPLVALACGGSVSATTVGGATRWPTYGAGCTNRDETGRELFYRVRRATAGTIQLAMTGSTTDLDLIVSGVTASGACTPDVSCIASAQTSAQNPTLGFTAAANTDYIVAVDGFAGAAGAFTLQVTCP